jgi:hypothetical protein
VGSNNEILGFKLNGSSTPTSITPGGNGTVISLGMDPQERVLYTVAKSESIDPYNANYTLVLYTIEATTGMLTPTSVALKLDCGSGGRYTAYGDVPRLMVDPAGHYVYLASTYCGLETIAVAADASSLSHVDNRGLNSYGGFVSYDNFDVALDPSGRNFVAFQTNKVTVLPVDPTTGKLGTPTTYSPPISGITSATFVKSGVP